MKKLLVAIITLIIVFGSTNGVIAMEEGVAHSDTKEITTKEITEEEAIELARWFIANDIYENKNDGWSEDTFISSIETTGEDFFVIHLDSNAKGNGYIVVGKDISGSLIQEFAYEGEPLFANLLPLPAENQFEKSVDVEKVYIPDQTEENMPYLSAVRREIAKNGGTKNYGGITDPYSHVNATYGSGWSYHSSNSIPLFTPLNMNNFTGPKHCSLVTLTAIFNYHRGHGYPAISTNVFTLYNRIKKIATDNGYYSPSTGTMPYYIDNLATKVWAYYGYSGTGNNDFFFWSLNTLNNTLKKEVDGYRPGAISFNSGYYGKHTVTYFGYIFYKKAGQQNKMYLKVNDNWTTAARYVDTTRICQLGQTLFEICRVLP